MKPILFIPHARQRLDQRGATEEDVAAVLRDPAITLPTRRGRLDVIGYVGGRPLRVVYVDLDAALLVITAYWVTL